MKFLDAVRLNLIKKLPKELADKLIEHYLEIKNNFTLLKHENTEINASKFSEAVFRIIEYALSGNYTPLGQQIHQFTDKCRQFENTPSAGKDDSLRIHIPRTLILILDIRNKRGVGHVSGIHNPNLADSMLVTKCADWVLAELLRLFNNLSLDEAQRIVDQLVSIDLPIVAKIAGIKRVLRTDFKYGEQVLILLYEECPALVLDKDLFKWIEHSNFSAFKRDILKTLHSKRCIEYNNGQCLILPPGKKIVEELLARK
jgi:hypothetical protein